MKDPMFIIVDGNVGWRRETRWVKPELDREELGARVEEVIRLENQNSLVARWQLERSLRYLESL